MQNKISSKRKCKFVFFSPHIIILQISGTLKKPEISVATVSIVILYSFILSHTTDKAIFEDTIIRWNNMHVDLERCYSHKIPRASMGN